MGRLSKTSQERIQADQKLFECFHSQASAAASASRSRSTLPFPTPGIDGFPEPNLVLDDYMAKLEEDAARAGTEEGWLRLARWRLWNHDLKGALAAANSALEINRKSTAAYGVLLVNVNVTNGPSPRAGGHPENSRNSIPPIAPAISAAPDSSSSRPAMSWRRWIFSKISPARTPAISRR